MFQIQLDLGRFNIGDKMPVYMIGYDLHPSEGQEYDDLIDAIERLFPNNIHPLDSTWIVNSNSTAEKIRDLIKPHIYQDDQLLILKIASSPVTGKWSSYGLSKFDTDWLKKNIL